MFVIQLAAIAELELVKDELRGANPLIFVYGIHGFGPNSVQLDEIEFILFKNVFLVLIMLIGYEVKWTLTGSYGPGNVFDDA